MSLFNVIHDIDDTLRFLIKTHLQEEYTEFQYDDAIIFDSPADIVAPNPTAGTAKVSIFLYQIVENCFLKNNGREFSGNDFMEYPPLYLDLYYLFTPYAGDRDKEHTILERIMTVFHDYTVLNETVLQGNLVKCGNKEIRTVSHSFSFDEINKLWERFPNKPFKLSVAYMLTPVRVPSLKEPEPIARVAEKIVNIKLS